MIQERLRELVIEIQSQTKKAFLVVPSLVCIHPISLVDVLELLRST